MTSLSPNDNSDAFKCIECGAAISSYAKFCLKCGAFQTKAVPTSTTCVACGAEIPQVAKFCEECGTLQTAVATGSPEQNRDARADGQSANELSNGGKSASSNGIEPTEGRVDERASKRKRLLKLISFGILGGGAVVVASIAWFNSNPISPKAQYELGGKYFYGHDLAPAKRTP